MKKIIHLDLFSGIGGFAYAADQVWNNVEHIFCDNDKFCQQVLNKHWPEAKIYDDIRSINTPPNRVELLTGGFPCQPFSAAGLRRGTADERHLWPEMLRVIRLTKPTWIIAENVRGILTWNEGLVFEQVCTDMEAEGYEVQPFILPAIAINAPHRRDRVWFVAYRASKRPDNRLNNKRGRHLLPDENRDAKESKPQRSGRHSWTRRPSPTVTNSRSSESRGLSNQSSRYKIPKTWERNWLEVAAELCGVDDGLSTGLDGFELTKPQHRQERLKSLGNAIVPQVAMEIMRGMAI